VLKSRSRFTPEPPTTRILVCLPAYNEAENIGRVLAGLLAYRETSLDFDILVIDDGSTDNTAAMCREHGVLVISQIYNIGYGAALKTAYKFAMENDYDYIIQMDADGQHDISNVAAISYFAGTHDVVIGSRFLDEIPDYYTPFHKKFIINFFRLIIRFTSKKNITDPTSGLQGLSREAFSFYAKFDNFAIDYPDANMIVQMILNDFSVLEIPASMRPRTSGESMHTGLLNQFRYIILMVLSTLIVFMREIYARRQKKKGAKE